MSAEDELGSKLKVGMRALQEGKLQPSRDKKLLKSVRRLKPEKCSSEMALLASQWVLMYHTMVTMNSETKKEALEHAAASKEDMPRALALLDAQTFEAPSEKMTVLLLKSDICQRIPDFVGLNNIYKELRAMGELPPQLQVITLSSAPILGNWKEFLELCGNFEKSFESKAAQFMPPGMQKPPVQDVLHSFTDTGLPDFGIVYDFIHNRKLIEEKHGAPRPEELYNETVEVKKVELDIDSVSAGGEEEKENELREQFKNADSSEFNFDNMAFTVNGGLILAPGISAQIPMQLVGVYVGDENQDIELEGYVDLQMPKLDENGNPIEPDIPPEMKMSPDMLPAEVKEAFETGQVTPEILEKIPPETMQAMQNMMAMERQQQQNIMATIRQREKLVMKKKADGSGYSGKYYIWNVPVDPTTNKPMPEGETSIVFNAEFQCSTLPAPAKSTELKEEDASATKATGDDVEKIASGIDDLELD